MAEEDNSDDEVGFIGVAHPTAKPDDYKGAHLTRSEMQEAVNEIEKLNIPLFREHDGDIIGKLTGADIDEKGQLMIRGQIHRKNETARRAIKELRSGELSQLSTTLDNVIFDGSKIHPKLSFIFEPIGPKPIMEVSLVKEGDRPNSVCMCVMSVYLH